MKVRRMLRLPLALMLVVGIAFAIGAPLARPATGHAQTVSATVSVCGTVTAYTAAGAAVPGVISIGGVTYPIAPGTVLTGAGLIHVGANLCLQAGLNAGLQISNGGVSANASVPIHVCGTVTAYTAATASSPGSITIGGTTYPIAAGTTLGGAGLLTANPNVCLQGTLNALGQISSGGVSASGTGSATVNVCGTVTAYAAATAVSNGSITIGGQTFPIAAGTTLNGAGLATSNANLCLAGTLNAAGQLSNGTLSANGGATVNVCGVVAAYQAATASVPGSITIGGTTYPIAAGTTLSGAGLATSNANLCLAGTLNAAGQLSNGTLTANGGATVNVCGVVTAYTPATATAAGALTLGGQTVPIAAGTTLTGSNLITSGANLCLNGTTNAAGQVSSGGVSANANASVHVCGVVTAYQSATASAPGSITIAGQTFAIGAGTALNGSNLITANANLCLQGALNGAGQISSGGVSANGSASATLSVCGVVSTYTAATAGAPGALTINGTNYPIAAGATLNGNGLLTNGANVCLQGTVDGSGQIQNGTVTANASASISVCGVVSNYTQATAGAPGSLTLGGTTYPIASGTTLSGASLLTNGTNVCLQGTVNGSGQISGGGVSFNGVVQVSVCGLVTNYTAATGSNNGTLTIAGITFPIAAGAAVNGATTLAVGLVGNVALSLNGLGLISAATVTSATCPSGSGGGGGGGGNGGGGGTITGPVSVSVSATATSPGSITIGGTTYQVAPGTVLIVNAATPLAATLVEFRGGALWSRYLPE